MMIALISLLSKEASC